MWIRLNIFGLMDSFRLPYFFSHHIYINDAAISPLLTIFSLSVSKDWVG